jgi:class 3 adenylate cyclase
MTTVGTEQNSFLKWLLTIPDDVPKETRRYYLYWRVFYFLGGAAHVMGGGMFLVGGVTFMAWFNLISIPIFVASFMLLQRGFYRLPFWLVNGELIAHGVAATVCVGALFGFQCYIFLVIILTFVQPFYRLQTSMMLAAGALISVVAVMLYTWNAAPFYVMPDEMMALAIIITWTLFPMIVIAMVLPFIAEGRRAEKELEAAYGESESLLLNILPKPIAHRLKQNSGMIADNYDQVAIMFADIVGFTDMSNRLAPDEVVKLLNNVFNGCDELAEKYRVEKIKTIGDAYMVVAGLPTAQDEPEAIIAAMALEMLEMVKRYKLPDTGEAVQMRIGINCGRVVAGVIGQRKFAYDLWGDAVNIAARMESAGTPGKIQLPSDLAAKLSDRFIFEDRGVIDVKGKGKMATSFLVGKKS